MRIIIIFLLLFIPYILSGQCTQTNTSCATATPLTINSTCESGSTCNSANLPVGTATSCTLFNIPNLGVWYSFVAIDAVMNVIVDNVSPLACFNRVLVFEGACGALTEVGCVDSTQVSILYQEEPIVYILNTFKPYGDQYNHVFLPVFTSAYDPYNYELLIFSLWGEIV